MGTPLRDKIKMAKKRFKLYTRIFASLDKGVVFFVITSILVLLIKIFFYDCVPELFNHGKEIANTIEGLCLSIIASFIFYFIGTHIEAESNKEKIYPYIENQIARMIDDCKTELHAFGNPEEALCVENSERKEIESAISKINPKEKAPFVSADYPKNANWIDFLEFNMNRTLESIKRILNHITYLDSELILILTKIESCEYFKEIKRTKNLDEENKNLNSSIPSFYTYNEMIRELASYKKKLKVYSPNSYLYN